MSVASKNLYDLLGNDIEDPDAAPKAPTKIVEKATTHTVKRNADGVAPAKAAGADAGFRDRQSGNASNNTRARNDADQAPRGGRGARVRGGRGARRPPPGDERHSRNVPSGGSDKQAALSWGATEGEAELKDEIVGEQIAKADQKEAVTEDATAPEELPVEEEDKSISYADYLVQQAEKKLALEQENALKVRKANEGSKADKKWANAKELVKSEEEEVLFAGAGGKAKRERERKQKQFVELENRFIEAPREGGERRGGRGGARGEFSGRGRGEGGRGRGEGRGRGGPRGGARGDFRGDFRGGRGGARAGGAAPVNPNDQSAFPSLGS
ncbi:hypothetical protein CONLIGDRAFT_627954 [Coniochaeta ligniaria NRRL 30616]|uniref:Hyaluronan/mRNA-binding protein domain-containing protein n=1 Tax=Coniochaeta ligniaria NRRL 30616 TaxID=1408157 RepID=A0A1J7JSP8_9PEZI|nr:hypothetical protein CONLIGDRAFT_627954 [Coniochaeta ligniaria NRRL 30616]